MKKILLVSTGGTIGSTLSFGTIDTDASARLRLMDLLASCYPRHREFEFHPIQPLELLSENLVPSVWEQLVAAVEIQPLSQFDGIIITHGTDTLSFTAAALSFCWHSLPLPVLLVASDYPLEDSRANGLANMVCALEFIRQIGEPGVFVPYQNRQQEMSVHWGTHLASSLQLSGDFISVRQKNYLSFDGRQFSVLNPCARPSQAKTFAVKARFSKRILMIRPYPGLNYDYFDIAQADAVLHDLYHSGTAAVSRQWGANHALPEFINRCRERGIQVYLAPAHKSSSTYQTTQTLLDHGAEMIWNLSLEAAYVKLLLAYGNFDGRQTISDFLQTDIAGEHILD